MTDTTVYIGLGSNLDNPVEHVRQALKELSQLPEVTLLKHSSLYKSAPVGPQDQDDFINAVAALSTTLSAETLLDKLQHLEQLHRRVRNRHWGPRTLDLDIILYGSDVIDTERLNVPHPYMKERNFVLYPLAEIQPDLTLPCGTSLSSLISSVHDTGLHRYIDT